MNLNQICDLHVENLVQVLALRDIETESHTRRVAYIVQGLGYTCGLSEGEIVTSRRGALLHDIGKIGVPDEILHKKSPLTEEERVVISLHPVVAYELLHPIPYLRSALDIPYCHHEKWDGTGYPCGLKGNQIPFVARLFAVVDTWDALLSDRPYRSAWSFDQVVTHIIEQSGKSFEPDIVSIFINSLDTLCAPVSEISYFPSAKNTVYRR